MIRKYIGDLFLPTRFYLAAGCCALVFILSFFLSWLYPLAQVILAVYILLLLVDYVFLFFAGRPPAVNRIIQDRLSNGDENKVVLRIRNRMSFRVHMDIIDELPEQLQVRDFILQRSFAAKESRDISYRVRPTERGIYAFGKVILYAKSSLGLLARRFRIETGMQVSVYPSFMHFRKYQLMAHTAHMNEQGNKRVRKIGQSMEFEQIKEYITGDDIRTINWKATARKGDVMVNHYMEEKSQQVYCIIDKGRLMKMPFKGLTLLDYTINSSLVLSGICLQKQDKIGLMTFSEKMGAMVAADRKPVQREKIMQVLYKQQTAFLESDFEMLYAQVRNKIKQRSLIVLYTNFESLNGLRRQLPYLRSIARYHLLLLVFFENTELSALAKETAENLEDVYVRTVAEKFLFEKKCIVKELQKYGILTILTAPENLTVDTVNKYLELKNRQAI